jgi:isopenicillin N synthase-like dioxygenase
MDLDSPELLVKSLYETSCVIVKDPSINTKDQEEFIDLMCQYFEQSYNEKLKDVRKDTGYQVGVTPNGIEIAKCSTDPQCLHFIQTLTNENKPTDISNQPDPKWRFLWEIGNQKRHEPVIPEKFKENWENVMNHWGNKLLNIIQKVTSLIEQGLDLQKGELTDLLKHGSHLLAPTGTPLSIHNKVYARFHYDISFLTIHGKSNYPGLYIWLRDGTRVQVKIPDGCLLIQVGKQLEWLTGGYFKAGYHEVISPNIKENNKWRISSTLFSHVDSEKWLEPLSKFENTKYPRIKEKDFIYNELKSTNLYIN